MSIKDRRSPSGPLAEQQIPIRGCTAAGVSSATTEYLEVGDMDLGTEDDGKYGIPEPGFLRTLTVQHVVAGVAPAFLLTYNVRKNGVLIPGATGTRLNTDQSPLEIDCGVVVDGPSANPTVVQDLISVQVVTAAFGGGTAPSIRTSLTWSPGATF